MSSHEGNLLLLCTNVFMVLFRIYFLVHSLWKLPLKHGSRFFLGLEVPEGFYEGPGAGWLRRYRALILTEHLIEAAIVALLFNSNRLDLVPLLAVGSMIVLVTVMSGFMLWARRRLDTGSRARSKVAVALEPRRLGDYLSWRAEALAVAVMALCWTALATHGDARTRWQPPIVTTYVVLALAASQILAVRSQSPLPAERTEEYYQYSKAQRRYSLRILGITRWFCLAILAGYAMQHTWEPARTIVWLRWFPVGVAIAILLIQAFVLFRGQDRLASMVRDLRPIGSWSVPFQPFRFIVTCWLTWMVCFCSGLVIIHLLFRR
jgi:hypothetical protein